MTPSGAGEGTTPHPSEASDPRRLHLVPDNSEPTPAGTVSAHRPPTHLPLELSSFVGREGEIREVARLLGANRLVTLTGSGGCGKTRLAMAAAFEVVENFEDGAWWVGLASLSDPGLVPQEATQALGISELPDRAPAQALVDHVGTRNMLLVLDNCEHLIEACAVLAGSLLRACPELSILATSREALNISGERAWSIPPLSVPVPRSVDSRHVEQLARYEAVRLFVERARSVTSTFELTDENAPSVAQLCRRLDGLPLALELAAARTKVLSVEQILERLEDSLRLLAGADRSAPERHRTLRGALDWSYELLEEPERRLFRRLAAFAGGWTLEAAETVGTGDGIESEEVLDLLSGLVEKSLVAAEAGAGAARYRMLEPVRQYGLERLEGDGEAERVSDGHARYYLALAEEAETGLREQGAWLDRLSSEHDNFRVALRWALASDGDGSQARAELGLRLAAALGQARFWIAYGPSEGLGWLDRALVRIGDLAPAALRAKALNEAGWITLWKGDYEGAAKLLDEGLAIFKLLGDKPGLAQTLFHLGHVAIHHGDRERTLALQREAEALRHELTDQQATAYLLILLAMVAMDERDFARMEPLYMESMSLHRELGDMRGTAMCLIGLGLSALEQGDAGRAAALIEENLTLLREVRDRVGIVFGLLGMAALATLRGEPVRASRLWGAAEALREAIPFPTTAFERSHYDYEGYQAAARSQLDEAAFDAAWTSGRAMTPEEAIDYALAREVPKRQMNEPSLLSGREVEVLRLVADGLTDAQVAERLYLSPRTVGQHLRSVYRKLGVPSRAAAAREAVQRSLI